MKQTWHHFEKTRLFRGGYSCVKALHQAGHEAYFVGGCLRDLLLGFTPKDVDIATSANPEQVERIFQKNFLLDHGRRFGTLSIEVGDYFYEVTTFRGESNYVNKRHPQEVYWSNRKKDALRRDFTINALFYDPLSKELIDDFSGLDDLKKGLIRTVGEGKERFAEDSLRRLRALRFVAQTGFSIEPQTFQALSCDQRDLSDLSSERVHSELEKLFTGPFHQKAFHLLCTTGILSALFQNFLDAKGLQDVLKLSSQLYLNPGEYWWLFSYSIASHGEHRFQMYLDCVLRMRSQKKSAQLIFQNFQSFLGKDTAHQLRLLETREGLFLYDVTYSQFPEEQKKLENLKQKFLRLSNKKGQLPRPLVRAEDLKSLEGKALGETLNRVYNFQLEHEIFDKAEVLKAVDL